MTDVKVDYFASKEVPAQNIMQEDDHDDKSIDGDRTASTNISATSSARRELFITSLCILLNIVATVAIIFLNKTVYLDEGLKNTQVATAIYHFSVTFLVLLACGLLPRPARLFEVTFVPVKRMIPISAFFSASVVLGNLSLAYNSVGFFQLTKILITPCIVLFNFALFRITTSRMRLFAVALCCIGAAMTNTKEAYTNPLGAMTAVVSIIVAALYQIWIGKRMKDLDVSAPQLLLNQAPLSVVMLLVLLPFSTKMPDFSQIEAKVFVAFILSGFAAALVNLSQFLIIGRTSALTFTIIGILKTVLIISAAPFFETTQFTVAEYAGILVAISGIWTYAREGFAAKPAAERGGSKKAEYTLLRLQKGGAGVDEENAPMGLLKEDGQERR